MAPRPRGDPRRVADALGAAPADLAATAAASQAGARAAARSARPGPRRSPRRDRSRGARRAAGAVGTGTTRRSAGRRGEPLDPVRHQLGDRQQAAELQRRDQVAGDALVRRRGPGAVEPGGPAPRSGSAAARRRAQRVQSDRLRSAGAPAGGAERRHQDGRAACRGSTPRSCGAPARAWRAECQKLRQDLATRARDAADQHARPRGTSAPCKQDRVARAGRRRRSGSRRRRSPGPGCARRRRSRRRRRPAPGPRPRRRRAGWRSAHPPPPRARRARPRPRRAARRSCPGAARRGCRCRSSRRRSRASRRERRPRAVPGRRPSPSRRTRRDHRRPGGLARPGRREEVEDLGAEHVDAAVGEVRERFGRVGLLLEALDAAVGVGDRDAELARCRRPAWSPGWRSRRGTRGTRASPPGRCR